MKTQTIKTLPIDPQRRSRLVCTDWLGGTNVKLNVATK
jgi:hypothetical protein